MDVNDPERGSAGFKWVSLKNLPPSKPISEKWLSRRRVSLVGVSLIAVIAVLFLGRCDPPPPEPGTVSNEQFEAWARLNDFRGPDLVPTGELFVKAQAWSEHMADLGGLSHSDPGDGVTPGWTIVAENVASATSLQGAQAALEASPPHRANMLNSKLTEGGVGVVERNGTFWLTQNFAGR